EARGRFAIFPEPSSLASGSAPGAASEADNKTERRLDANSVTTKPKLDGKNVSPAGVNSATAVVSSSTKSPFLGMTIQGGRLETGVAGGSTSIKTGIVTGSGSPPSAPPNSPY